MQPLTIEHIETEMAAATLSPGQLSDYRVYLAALASSKTGRLQDILTEKPQRWLAIREHKKSDTSADREYDATSLGIEEMNLRYLLRRIDRLSGALSTKLRVLELEARAIV
jgi:hypothetical protein